MSGGPESKVLGKRVEMTDGAVRSMDPAVSSGPDCLQFLQRTAGNSAINRLLQQGSDGVSSDQDGEPSGVARVLEPGGGQPLDPALRDFMEYRFGHDFSQVRVHTNPQAEESAEAVNALAYTVGQHVVFGPKQFAPATAPGRQLLAHELAHVVQQTRGGQAPRIELSATHEQAADKAGEQIASSQGPIVVEGATGIGMARATKTPEYRIPPQQIYQVMEQMSSELAALRKAAPPSSGPQEEGMRTFCLVKVVGEDGQIKATATGAFLGKGPHAEQIALSKIDAKSIAATDTMVLIVDQWPCRETCRPLLHKFKADVAGEFRVLTRVNLDPQGFAQSPKTPAKRGDLSKAHLDDIEEFHKPRQLPSGSNTPPKVTAESTGQTLHPETPKALETTPTPVEELTNSPKAPTSTTEPPKTSPGAPKSAPPALAVPETPGTTPPQKIRAVTEAPQTPELLDVPEVPLKLPPWVGKVQPPPGNVRFIPFPIGHAPNEITRLFRIMRPIIDFLRSFGPLIGAAIQVALELVNAVQAYGMAVSGLAGRGFIFTEELQSSRKLDEATAAMLEAYQSEEYQQLRYRIFLEMVQIAGGTSKEAKAALLDEASFMLGLASMRLDEANRMYEQAMVAKQEVDEKKKAAEQLVDSRAFAGITGVFGTVPRAQAFAAYRDLEQISTLLSRVLGNTKTLIPMMESDKKNLEVFSK